MENMKAVRIHNCGGPEVLLGGDNPNPSRKVLKKGGILAWIVAPPSTEEAAKHGVRSAFFAAHPSFSQLSEIAKLVDATETSGRKDVSVVRSSKCARSQ